MLAPELQIHTEVLLAATNNMLHSAVYDHNNVDPNNDQITRINLDRTMALADDADAVADHLNVLLFGGQMPSWLQDPLVAHLRSLPIDSPESRYARAVDAIYICVASPAFIVQV